MSSQYGKTREKILCSAWELLVSDSARGVRMSDIARLAGVSRQAVYLHFPSRTELLIATTRYIDEVKDIDRRLAASREASSARERLEAFIAAWCGYIPEIHGVARALITLQNTDEAARAAWTDRMSAVRQGCEAAVSALKAEGDLSPSLSKREATDLLWGQLSVENWEHLRQRCGWSQAHYLRAMQSVARKTLLQN